jgi:hypothetical protein
VTALLDGRSNNADTLPTLKVRCHCSAQTSHAHGEDYDVTAPELGICLEQDLRVSRAKYSRFHERKQPRSRASQRSMSLDEL